MTEEHKAARAKFHLPAGYRLLKSGERYKVGDLLWTWSPVVEKGWIPAAADGVFDDDYVFVATREAEDVSVGRCHHCTLEFGRAAGGSDEAPRAEVAMLLARGADIVAEKQLAQGGDVRLCRYCLFRLGRAVMIRDLAALVVLGVHIGLDDEDAGSAGADYSMQFDLEEIRKGLEHLLGSVEKAENNYKVAVEEAKKEQARAEEEYRWRASGSAVRESLRKMSREQYEVAPTPSPVTGSVVKVTDDKLFRVNASRPSAWSEFAVVCSTGALVEIAARDEGACNKEGVTYQCSRLAGHEGRHVACVFCEHDTRRPEEIVEEWDEVQAQHAKVRRKR